MSITLQQTKAWYPCNRQPGEKYDDAHLEQLFAGEPATWARAASLPIDRCDVVWLATRPGALTLDQRDDWIARVTLPSLGPHGRIEAEPGTMLLNLLAAEAERSRRDAERWARAATHSKNFASVCRTVGEVGWGIAARDDARAARYAARAAEQWAACAAWEACLWAEYSGVKTWDEQVELLLEVVGCE